ncbi:MAG: MFS transporter [Chloroflexota bacterium]|nr:MAG: MFS transporter [Chloroflexota bacterium]
MPLHIPPSLHHRSFRLLWIGQAISVAGSQMQIWALLWHVRLLTDQPIALGGIGLARILPVILFSLLGGAVADSANRRRVLFVTQTVMAFVALVLAWLTFKGQITLWQIYALTAIQAMAVAFDLPARQALIPNLVPAKDLSNAFSMQSIALQVGSIIGPALSGLVIAYWGQYYTYLINAVSFLAVIVALLLIGSIPQRTRGSGRIQIKYVDIIEGVRFILKQPVILSSMMLDFFATFFSSANTLMPIFARDILKVGAVEYGWLSAAQSIGAMAAASIISQLREIKRQGRTLLISVIAFGFATILFGVSRSFNLAMIALVIIGASDSVSAIIRNTIRQLQTPDYIRGRMTSINQIFFLGGPQLGEVEAGLVAQLLGAPIAVITGGIGCLLAVGWIAQRWPQLRNYNGDEPIEAGAMAD